MGSCYGRRGAGSARPWPLWPGCCPCSTCPCAPGRTCAGLRRGWPPGPGSANMCWRSAFRGDLFVYLEPALLWERLKIMGNVLTFQFSLPVLALHGPGLVLFRLAQGLAAGLPVRRQLRPLHLYHRHLPRPANRRVHAARLRRPGLPGRVRRAGWPDSKRPYFTRIVGPPSPRCWCRPRCLAANAALSRSSLAAPERYDTRDYAGSTGGGPPGAGLSWPTGIGPHRSGICKKSKANGRTRTSVLCTRKANHTATPGPGVSRMA